MSIKALVVGVSDYSAINQNNLPFCANDIVVVTKALIEGLAVKKSNIITLGNNDVVSKSDFIQTLHIMISNTSEEDTFIFLGMGGIFSINTTYYLVME